MAIDAGPPVRGTKLQAYRFPPVARRLRHERVEGIEGSIVPWAQARLLDATRTTLAAVAADINQGLSETTGVKAVWVDDDGSDERACVMLELPPDIDVERVAHAIDLENVEAWLDSERRVCVGIGLWNSTKDTDQTVLAITKVTHVMLGMHAPDIEPHTHPHR